MNANRHKAYLTRLIHSKQVFFITMILPAFLWGWRLATMNRTRVGVAAWQLLKLSLFTVLAQIRTYLLSSQK